MTSSTEQADAGAERPRSGRTRQRLLAAAAQLIAEVGWGQVTTRAVAQRAALPLGAVSYHFRGKRDLLTQAALATVEDVFPTDELAAVDTIAELTGMMAASVGDHDSTVVPGVLVETLREATRDPGLADRVTALLTEYRRLLADLVRTEQLRGAVRADTDPAALATLLAAAGDGLMLHALLDADLDGAGAVEALRTLLDR